MNNDKDISQLPVKTSLESTDFIPIVDNAAVPGITKSIEVAVLDERYGALNGNIIGLIIALS